MTLSDIKNQKILLLCSGGPDSTYLFHECINYGLDFSVLHVNHHLRGDESDREESFVGTLGERHEVPVYVFHFHADSSGNTQAQAREFRYQKALETCHENKIQVILTAHHLDDHLETLCMRKKRGASLKGLCGIRHQLLFQEEGDIKIMRPLLGFSKEKILKELKERQIEFCQDSSNENTKYFRNRTRFSLSDKKLAVESILEKTFLLQSYDEYFHQRTQSLFDRFQFSLEQAVIEKLPEEILFRYFSLCLLKLGFDKQVERKHFHVFLYKQKRLDLGGISCLRGPRGWQFQRETQPQ